MTISITNSDELQFRTLPGRASADPFESREGMNEINLSVRVVKVYSDPERSAHVHPNSAEAVYVAAGNGTLWAEGVGFEIQRGDTFLVPAGTKHATLPDPGSEMTLICFFPHPDLSKNIVEMVGRIAPDSPSNL